ncbi:MAG: hypothetical protein IPM79_08425 [Polyangiaceae bacterium]|jgi:hypothetical protein|nr:hypothetical protein [Polyangiaceae bacterium]MBK8937655.1 hypothetical protein [Polyangiaceae bacterium]
MTRDPSSLAQLHDATSVISPSAVARRPYQKPELISYGRVEDMTRAGKKSGKEASKKPRSAL